MAQQDWHSLYNQSIEDYNNYNLAAAKEKCLQSLDLLTQAESAEHPNIASILRQLALICYDEGTFEEGLEYAIKEKELLIKLQKNGDENFAITLYNIGLLYSANGDFELAQNALKESKNLMLQYHADNDLEIAEIEGNLAITYYYLLDWEACDPLFKSALAIMDRSEEQSPEYANILYTYGDYCLVSGQPKEAIEALLPLDEAYKDQGSSEQLASIEVKIASAYEENGEMINAVNYYEAAIGIFENLSATDHEDYLIALNNLSLLYQRTGQLQQAENLMSEVVAKNTNPNDPAYLIAMANLGNIYYMNENFELAQTTFDKTIDQANLSSPAALKPYLLAMNGATLLLIDKGMSKEALDKSEQAIEQAGSNTSQLIPLLKSKATAQIALGQYADAESTLKQILPLTNNHQSETNDVKARLASLYTSMNQLSQAEALYAEIRPFYESQADIAQLQYVNFLGNYAAFLQANNEFVLAEEKLIQALETKKKLFGVENPSYISSYENIGVLYLTLGKYSNSKEILESVYQTKIKSSAFDDVSKGYTLSNLGVINRAMGNFGEAEEYLIKSLDFYEKSLGKEHIYYANTSNELGLLYMKMGNTKAARIKLESAMTIFESTFGKYHIDYVSALENLASLNYMEGEVEVSKTQLEEALEIDKIILGIEHPLYSKTLHNLASILEELGAYDEASRLYAQSLEIAEKNFGKEHPSYASTLYNLAVLKQEQEQFEEAESLFKEVVALRSKLLNANHPDLAYSYYGLASVKQKTGDFNGAQNNYRTAIQSYLESINSYFPSLSEEEKSAFYAKIKPVFEAYQDFAVEFVFHKRGDQLVMNQMLADLYDLQLQTKALLLNASNKIRNAIMNSGDAALIAKFNEWQAAKEELVKSLNLSNDELKRNNISIATMQANTNSLEKEISKMSTAFAGEYDQQTISWVDVQSKISEKEKAIEILRIKKNTKNDSIYYAALVLSGTPGTFPELVVIEDGVNMELKYFKQYKNMIVYKIENPRSYGQFWKPIDELLKDTKRIYLSSDGVYNKININTLYDPDKKEYVFDKYAIDLLSNTKELTENETSSQTPQSSRASIFGFPDYELGSGEAVASTASTERGFESGISSLPGTLIEINNIAETLDQNFWKYEKYEAAEANEVNVKKVNNPKLLHIATHGFFMSDMTIKADANEGIQTQEARFNPLLRSGLLLAGASKTLQGESLPYDEDGILTAYEAMNLSLDETELVVMSACETGLGEVKNGEGVYGLQRAFIVAGADNLIMSLWKVNDETTQKLMSRFYSNWINGETKKDAFRQAIKSLKKEYKQPYYWGAFVILGN
ncbi:MAG: tetratricopeptide repeat protein [Reichenbachiella sp.]|uniref:tetratricopeptide repeat protein n=1 Tax=Reichenbachiella sp. TaxID=2184521 RepID=UPI0032979983